MATRPIPLPETIPLPAERDAAAGVKAAKPVDTSVSGLQGVDFSRLTAKGLVAAPEKHVFPAGKLHISAEAMPLNQFLHTALVELLQLNISVAPSIASRNDPITLDVVKPVEPDILLGMIEETLRLSKVGLLRTPSGISVVPEAELKTAIPRLVSEGEILTQGQVVAFIPLEYADINETLLFSQSVFKMGLHGRVIYNERLGAIVAMGDAERVKQFKGLIAALDRPSLKERSIRLIEPEFWQVDDLVETLTGLLEAKQIPLQDKAAKRPGLQFIALKKINSLVVVSPRKSWAEFVMDAAKRIDRPSEKGDADSKFVYFVKNTRAESLGDIISEVLSPNTMAASSTGKAESSAKAVAKQESTSGGSSKLKVVQDLQRNALIFVGSGDEYSAILPLIERLDIPARQVLIDVTIAEVKLNQSTKLGTEWSSKAGNHGGLSTGGLGLGSVGLNYSYSSGDTLLKLNALVENGDARILSRPRLLAMDGEQAKIQVGDQIAVLSSDSTDTSSGGDVVRTYNYIDTGIILSVTPAINEGGVVQLELSQEVSDADLSSSGETPPISKRTINTVLLSKSGQTVMIGGLIKRNTSEAVSKVPLLGDIPGIGFLFNHTTVTDLSTELVMLVTPYIINDTDEAAYYTEALRKELSWQ